MLLSITFSKPTHIIISLKPRAAFTSGSRKNIYLSWKNEKTEHISMQIYNYIFI